MDIDTARRKRVNRPWPVVTAVVLLLIFEAVWAVAGTQLVASCWCWWTADVHDRAYGELFWYLGVVLLAIALLYVALTVAVVHGRRRARDALVVLTVTMVAVAAYTAAHLADGWTFSTMVVLFSPLLGLLAVVLLSVPPVVLRIDRTSATSMLRG